jgi:hypothetical protein
VFDIDNVDLTVTGYAHDGSLHRNCQTSAGLAFEAIFVRIADEPSNAAPQASRR